MPPAADPAPVAPLRPGSVPVPLGALVAEGPALAAAADLLFPGCERHVLSREDLRPSVPFAGRLFAVLREFPSAACVALVVPVVAPGSPGPLLAVADHLDLGARGPLSGRWPPGVPRTFPSMTGIYQPAVVRARGGARVYSTGVVVAGVTDAGRLTPFEARAVVEGGCVAVSDTLVPAAVIAAYHGLKLAACGVPQGSAND
jgi:hypothetical protein